MVYKKANSFVEFSGVTDNAAYHRIQDLHNNLDNIPKRFHNTINTVFKDLFEVDNKTLQTFTLEPFVLKEIMEISDEELPRYLYYRYRYDIYPKIKKLDNFPPCVQIEPTSICNYRCVFCYQTDPLLTQGRHGHMGMMTFNLFKEIIDQIVGNIEAVTLASRGEPLMAKNITSMLEYLSGKFLGLKINTNASFLTEEKAHAVLAAEPNTLVFSADASDKELYSKLRVNGNLDKVISNIKMFNKIKNKHYPKSRTITRVSGVRFKNEQNFSEIEKFWNSYVNQVAFVQYNPWETVYSSPKNDISEHCSDLWRRTFIWWNGVVNPCDVDYRSILSVGNIENETLSQIWQGDKYNTLRTQHSTESRCKISPCSGCSVI
jgi:radical SAM protein with 4Fe4S-binding SPASM domain